MPTILTTVLQERGGYLSNGLRDVFPDQKPIDLTFIDTYYMGRAWNGLGDSIELSSRRRSRRRVVSMTVL